MMWFALFLAWLWVACEEPGVDKIRPEVAQAMLAAETMIPILVQFTEPDWDGPQDAVSGQLALLSESTLQRVGPRLLELQEQGQASAYRVYPIANALAIEATPHAIREIAALDDVLEVSTNAPIQRSLD